MLDHRKYMQAALSLAQRNLGQTWPNPSVGAVVVKDGFIVGQGWTARGGRPHAETEALAAAGSNAKGATLYVTLEPCGHKGKTLPCTDAVIKSGITRCVVACRDPNPLVNGKGIEQLKAADIEVIEGVGAEEATEINRGFFSSMIRQRPFVALKLATSMDGKIAFPPSLSTSRWITGETARAYGHLLRSRYDAIATGIGTVLADDPELTCRLPGLQDRSPVRIVLDSKLRLPPTSKLVKGAKKTPLWLLSSFRHKPESMPDAHVLEKSGVKILGMEKLPNLDPGLRRDDNIDITSALALLAEQGITRLLVEAGQKLSTAFLLSGLVDRIYWFRAPTLIGDEGLSALGPGLTSHTVLARWKIKQQMAFTPDTLDILECSPV